MGNVGHLIARGKPYSSVLYAMTRVYHHRGSVGKTALKRTGKYIKSCTRVCSTKGCDGGVMIVDVGHVKWVVGMNLHACDGGAAE